MLIKFLDIAGSGDGFSLSSADGIWGTISKVMRSIMYTVNELIYKLVIILYEVFESICKARLLDNETFMELGRRAGIVLGIIMLFKVIFSTITYLIDPNKMEDKDNGAISIIKKVLIVIVMLGTSSYVFEITWDFQNYIIEERVIYKILLPSDMELDTSNFGGVLAARTFTTFYDVEESLKGNNSVSDCEHYNNVLINSIIDKEDFSPGQYCLNAFESEPSPDSENNERQYFVMEYNFFLQLLLGGVLVYLLVSYVIKVGVRVVQLTVLQIISPMAIVAYLSPKKDNMFSKWCKIYFATYIDVFIRCAIIYFVVYLSALLLDSIGTYRGIFWENVGTTEHKTLIILAMILALLTFGKKAPDLMKDLFPAGASKLGLGASWKELVGVQKGAKIGASVLGGAAGGAAIGLLSGSLGGAVGGFLKGGLSGLKGQGIMKTASGAWKSEKEAIKGMRDIRANGGSWGGYQLAKLQKGLGIRTTYENLEVEYQEAQDYVNAYSAAKKKADSEVDKFASNYKFRDAAGNEFTLLELEQMKTDDVHYNASQRALFTDVYNKIHGFARDQAMASNGAVKEGEMIWEDRFGGDWKQIENNVNTAGVTARAHNNEIEANMRNVLNSKEAQLARGSSFERAKAANDAYEFKVNSKINDKKYKRSKANSAK